MGHVFRCGGLALAAVMLFTGALRADERVVHVVLVWLKEPQHRQRVLEATRSLRDIPGLLDLRAGEVLSSPRVVVDDSFDVGIVMTFQDQEAMRRYQEHPQHRKARAEVLEPLARRILIYDFVDSGGAGVSPQGGTEGGAGL